MNDVKWVRGEVERAVWMQARRVMFDRGLRWNQVVAEALALWLQQSPRASTGEESGT